MNIIITGAAGFIGSHFLELIFKYEAISRKFDQIIVIDLLTYASNKTFLKLLQSKFSFQFVQASITDRIALEDCIKQNDVVVNFAAESHVDNSLNDSSNFLSTNVLGVGVLLEVCKGKAISKFIQISTDEVYGSINKGSWLESQRLNPNSPYSASKAAADLLAISFLRSHKIPIIITRSSNNFGPRQNIEKFIPMVISKLIHKQEIPVYGNGQNIRDWIYVEDNVRALWEIITKGVAGEIYHIGGGNELSNLDLIEMIASIVGHNPRISFVKDRKAHDFRYSISTQKISQELDFFPIHTLKQGLEKTIKYFKID